MADGDDDVIFDRDDMVAIARGGQKKSKLTCNKLLITVILSASFFGLGLCFAIPGPTIIDLAENTGSHGGQVSLIFTSRSVGYLLGSVVGGVLFDHINQACLLSIAMLVTGLATGVAPWCRRLVWLAAMIMFQGISMGFLDTGGNLMCLETWGRDNGPHLQSLHFSFGIGAFLAPLLATPFLHNNTHLLSESNSNQTTHPNVSATVETSSSSPVKYSYLMIAIFVSLLSLGFVLLFFCNRKSSGSMRSVETLKSEYTVRQERLGFRIQMLVLLFFFYFLYVGLEVTYGSLVSKFAVEVYQWDKQRAALVASVYWGSFAAGRLLAIFLARCFNPTPMLAVDLLVSTASLAGLSVVKNVEKSVIESYVSPESLFWILTSTLGFGLASIFPTGISWIERYMKVTGRATAVFVVGSALGEMVLPALTAFLFEEIGPMLLMYVLLVASFASVIIYVVMVNLACSAGERYSKLASQDEDMQPLRMTEDDGLASSPADCPNGVEGADRKKRVTFILNSSDGAQSSTKEGASSVKGSILRSKRVEKKD